MEDSGVFERRFHVIDEEFDVLFHVELIWVRNPAEAEEEMRAIVHALNESGTFPRHLHFAEAWW